jgi:hypothetical protein
MMNAQSEAEENSREKQEPVALRILAGRSARRETARFEHSPSPP